MPNTKIPIETVTADFYPAAPFPVVFHLKMGEDSIVKNYLSKGIANNTISLCRWARRNKINYLILFPYTWKDIFLHPFLYFLYKITKRKIEQS